MLSGERERGTLALLLTQPLSLGRLLSTKGMVAWLLLVAPAVLVPVAWTLAVSPEAAAQWPSLAAYAVLVASYVAFWVALAAVVNLGGFGSAANAAIAGGLWLVLVVLLPGLLGVLTSRLYPVPSRLALISEARLEEVEASRQRDILVDRFFQDHPELMPAPGSGQPNRTLAFYVSAVEAQRAVEPVFERFEAQLEAQQRILAAAQFLSPAIVMREALTELAGTSRQSFAAFRRDVLRYRDALRQFLEPRVARGQPMTWNDYEAAPRFAATPARPRWPWEATVGIAGPALLLAAWARRRIRSIENPLTA
jgi:ABC-2 type transport system permease protein